MDLHPDTRRARRIMTLLLVCSLLLFAGVLGALVISKGATLP